MARTVRNPKIDTRNVRLKLPPRREPYWCGISRGAYIGYRRGAGASGTWIARTRIDGRQHYEAIGAADDVRDANGLDVLSFAQAQELARKWFDRKGRELAGLSEPQAGPYTVADAIGDYLDARLRRGSKGVQQDRVTAAARILPLLGKIDVSRLTSRQISNWHNGLATAPKRIRSARTGAQITRALDEGDVDAVRRRRATANRILAILRAALTRAWQEHKVSTDEAWRRIRPFREANAPVIRYLTEDECLRLANACQGRFRDLVRGALVTGCRYGELCRVAAADFDQSSGTVTVKVSKSGKPRRIVLAYEGQRLFEQLTTGLAPTDLIFTKGSGKPWGPSHQQRPLTEASKAAKLDPPATFHILRHTYASSLAMRGVPLQVIAAQLGHADTRVTDHHYAHLSPSYLADTIRAALPGLNVVEPNNVTTFRQEKPRSK
jgi:integrase